MLEFADFPAVGSTSKRVFIPAVLGVVVVAVPVRKPVPRNVVKNPISLVAMQLDMEVGVLMHDDQPLEASAGEPRPYLRGRRRRRATGEVEEVHLEGISQCCRVHIPVMQVQATPETEHDIADVLPVPQLAHHLVGSWRCSASHHRSSFELV